MKFIWFSKRNYSKFIERNRTLHLSYCYIVQFSESSYLNFRTMHAVRKQSKNFLFFQWHQVEWMLVQSIYNGIVLKSNEMSMPLNIETKFNERGKLKLLRRWQQFVPHHTKSIIVCSSKQIAQCQSPNHTVA